MSERERECPTIVLICVAGVFIGLIAFYVFVGYCAHREAVEAEKQTEIMREELELLKREFIKDD